MFRKLIVLLTIALPVLIFSAATAQVPDTDEIYSENGMFMQPMEPDPGIPDTVTVETKTVASGSTEFYLQISLYNDEELGGFNLPLTWDSPDIVCDSVSFVGSRVEYLNTKLFSIDTVNQRLQAGAIVFFEQYIQPGNGMIYTAYFTVSGGAADQSILFDSTFYPPGGNFALTLSNGFNIVPQFIPGTVTIGEPANPEIGYTPSQLNFTGVQGEPNPPVQSFDIFNAGSGDLEWNVSSDASWIGLTPTSGINDGSVEVSVNIASLEAGTFLDSIYIFANADNSPQKVLVELIVEPPPPTIQLDPVTFDITTVEGTNPPPEQLTITNVGGGILEWTATNQTGWITLNPTSGTGDGNIDLTFDITGVAPGTYYDTVFVSDPDADNSPQFAVVTLVVEPPPPTIQLDPVTLDITTVEGTNPPSEQLTITNVGGGTLEWTATNQTGWITLNPTSGTGDGTIELTFDITGVAPGTYYDTVFVSDPDATNDPQFTAITLVVEPTPPTIQLDPSSFVLNTPEGVNPSSEQISVTNVGGGTLEWTATNQTGWISLDPTGGTGDGTIELTFDITGVGPGTYYDTVFVSDPDATNDPQFTAVTLTIEAEAEPQIDLSPTALTFNASLGGGNPPEMNLDVTNLGGGELNWTASNNEAWLSLSPTSGTGDGTISVSVDIAGLAQGTYNDIITVSDPEAINSPQTAEVILNITDFAYGTTIIVPAAQHVIRAYAIEPMMNIVYIGDFGSYQVSDIDPNSITVNGSIAPESYSILPSHPDFTGEVMELVVAARPLILDYGLLYDTTTHEYTVSGQFNDQSPFDAIGEVTFFGHISGDVDHNGKVNIGDPVYILDYIFREGPAPQPMEIGDVNCDGLVNIGDVKFLLNYIFRDGAKPDCRP